ncbi:PspA/IM30 family protein [Neobacillus terrae]|uniref:PspA/IM30 family protein n=1 Tax=Neobacillus terrae TaxID=3034837 RepID=UPI00140AC965|nr:PspA/IM30 family protein [Neobacillus terrae]NHM31870.1 PspA/IM30 family protein [Neobacillus terrae]
MGILKRVKTIFTADLHEVLDKMENPLVMMNQHMRELEGQVSEAQKALAQQLYLENRYAQLVADAEALVAKRGRQAELAVSRNEEDVARLALKEKILQEEKLQNYQAQLAAIKNQTTTLQGQIVKMSEKYQELEYKKLNLLSRAHAAKAVRQSQESLSAFDPSSAVNGFAKVESYVQKLEAEAAASTQFYRLTTGNNTVTLNDDLQEKVNQELEKLKIIE